jgi:hypothetical protein
MSLFTVTHPRIKEMYDLKCNTPSDINELLPTIKKYADKCESVAELGVRTVVASWAFLASKAKFVSGWDLQTQPEVAEAKRICEEAGREWNYIEADVLKVELPQVDFLFIDTFHTYSQLKKELELHASKANKYLGFHDTTSFEFKGEDSYEAVAHNAMNCGHGLWPAIEEFLAANPEWKIAERLTNNNGLTILEKQ